MKHSYSRRFDPPAPVVVVRLHGLGGTERLDALIDSGADICGIPRPVAEMLELRPSRVAEVAGVHGRTELVVYRVSLDVARHTFKDVEAVAIDRPYALVGRNVLRRLRVTLDGPRGQLVF